MNREIAKATPQQAIAVIQRENQAPITITFQDVKNLINPLATDVEAKLFLKLCESEQLNPFENEIYLIKYSPNEKPAFVKSIDVFIKRAEKNPMFNGSEEGIILKTKNPQTGQFESVFREGEFLIDEEEPFLVGGWCRVYRKDREKPFYSAVRISEYIRYKRDGGVQSNWKEKPATMIVKVAKMRSLKHAFPNKPGDLPTEDEVSNLEPPFMKDGKPNWFAFWNKANELGLTEEEVHKILHVETMKDFVNQGNSLETAVDFLVKYQKEGLKFREVRQSVISDWMGEELAAEVIPPGQTPVTTTPPTEAPPASKEAAPAALNAQQRSAIIALHKQKGLEDKLQANFIWERYKLGKDGMMSFANAKDYIEYLNTLPDAEQGLFEGEKEIKK